MCTPSESRISPLFLVNNITNFRPRIISNIVFTRLLIVFIRLLIVARRLDVIAIDNNANDIFC